MTAIELMDHLRSLEIEVWLEGDRLRSSAPRGVLTEALEDQLRLHRLELIDFLRRVGDRRAPRSSMLPIQPKGSRPPFFGIPGHNGDVFSLVPLAGALGPDQPFFAYQPPGVDGMEAPLERIEAVAARFLTELKARQAEGPYRIGGYCTGGLVAFEAGRQLVARGDEVSSLVLFGTSCPTSYTRSHRIRALPVRAINRTLRILRERVRGTTASDGNRSNDVRRTRLERATTVAARGYRPAPYSGRITLFLPSDGWRGRFCESYLDWRELCSELDVHAGPADGLHRTMLREPYARAVAERLRVELRGAPGARSAAAP